MGTVYQLITTVLTVLGAYLFAIAAMLVLIIAASWKLYEKAGEPGWAALVPFYSQYVFLKIAWGNGWLFLIPAGLSLAGVVFNSSPAVRLLAGAGCLAFGVMANYKLARSFGKGGDFTVGLVLLNVVFTCILAFGKAEYIGPQRS